MTEFKVKQLILFPSYWKILRFKENKINWYRDGKVIFLSYSAREDTIKILKCLNCWGITVVD